MKLLKHYLPHVPLLILSFIICLIPFTDQYLVARFNSIQSTGFQVIFSLGGTIIFLFLASKFKYYIHHIKQNYKVMIMMVGWLMLIIASELMAETNSDLDMSVLKTTIVGFAMGWSVFLLSENQNDLQIIIRAISISAFVVILLGWTEVFHIEPFSLWFASTDFVDIRRVSSVFLHPNIMAAYLELTLPFIAIWMLLSRRLVLKLLLGFGLIAGLNILVLSLSRGGILAFSVALVIFGAIAFHAQRKKLSLVSLVMLGIILFTMIIQLLIVPRIIVRYVSEGSNENWYRAVYDVPETVHAVPGEMLTFNIDVTNTGLIDWEIDGDQLVNLGYHIICWDEASPTSLLDVDMSSLRYIVAEGPRTSLPYAITPDESASLIVNLTAPAEPGQYLIAWDMVQESVTWFNKKGATPASTRLIVEGIPDSSCGTELSQDTDQAHLSRLQLWQTALEIIWDHPLLGIGAGNFNNYAPHKDTSLILHHAHNMYLELMVDFGVLSSVFIFISMFWISKTLLKAKPIKTDKLNWYIWFGICIALTAFALHNIVDSFYHLRPVMIIACVVIGFVARFAVNKHDNPVI